MPRVVPSIVVPMTGRVETLSVLPAPIVRFVVASVDDRTEPVPLDTSVRFDPVGTVIPEEIVTLPVDELPSWIDGALKLAISAAEIASGPFAAPVVLPRSIPTPAARGLIVSCGLAWIAEPVVVARSTLLVTNVISPRVLGLPITLAAVVHAATPRLPEPVPSVPLRTMLPPLAVMV